MRHLRQKQAMQANKRLCHCHRLAQQFRAYHLAGYGFGKSCSFQDHQGVALHGAGHDHDPVVCPGASRLSQWTAAPSAAIPCNGLPIQRRPGTGNFAKVCGILPAYCTTPPVSTTCTPAGCAAGAWPALAGGLCVIRLWQPPPQPPHGLCFRAARHLQGRLLQHIGRPYHLHAHLPQLSRTQCCI